MLVFHRFFGFLPLSNLLPFDWGARDEQLQVHAALYRLDDHLRPVPQLAEDLCDVGRDGLEVSCQLREATFHDGSPVTADDVIFSYGVARSPNCPFAHAFGGVSPVCIGDWLASVDAVGSHGIRFGLTRPYAALVTEILPNVFITPRAVVEGQYTELFANVTSSDTGEITALADAIDAGLEENPPDCESQIEAGERLLERAGAAYAGERALWAGVAGQTGAVDACAWAERLSPLLRALGEVPRGDGIDGLAAAYPLLPFNEEPVGAGVFRFERVTPGDELVLTAFDDYVGGRARIDRVVWRVLADDMAAEALRRGELHISSENAVVEAGRDRSSVRILHLSDNLWTALQFNVREGALFADRNLRQAVARCADLPRLVDAALPGALPIVSPIVPTVHWAFLEGLSVPERDVDEAHRLVEDSGWTRGSDGVYALGGERLAFEVVYAADSGPRHQFLSLLSDQLTDCGMEMTLVQADFQAILRMFDTPPHLAPGTDEPFDAYFGGWGNSLDPNPADLFHTSRIPTGGAGEETHFNYIGWSDPRTDELLDQGLATYELNARARIYGELQAILADELPYLFAWNEGSERVVTNRLGSASGPLNTESPNMLWELEALTLSPQVEEP